MHQPFLFFVITLCDLLHKKHWWTSIAILAIILPVTSRNTFSIFLNCASVLIYWFRIADGGTGLTQYYSRVPTNKNRGKMCLWGSWPCHWTNDFYTLFRAPAGIGIRCYEIAITCVNLRPSRSARSGWWHNEWLCWSPWIFVKPFKAVKKHFDHANMNSLEKDGPPLPHTFFLYSKALQTHHLNKAKEIPLMLGQRKH